MRGPTLPAGPKVGGSAPAMRKPPSLSTLAMPNFSGIRAPSESLLNALRSLIARLPEENRDLLHTVTDLIKATARRSKETKMPLSNLLLVFCPSLNMNPPLLRVLCEAEGIWDIPPSPLQQPSVLDIKRQSITMDIGPVIQSESPPMDGEEVFDPPKDEVPTSEGQPWNHNSEGQEAVSEVPWAVFAQLNLDAAVIQQRRERTNSAYGRRPLPRAPSGARREPVETLYLDSESADDLVLQSSAASTAEILPYCATTSELWSSKDNMSASRSSSVSPALPNLSSPPSLSSSTDSLTSSETPSSSHLPLQEGHFDKTEVSPRPHTPAIVEPADLPLPPTPRRATTSPTVGGEILFPSTSSSAMSSLNRRPSVPGLSTKGSTPPSPGPTSASSLRTRRIKKPSLNLLFTRRSSASLHSASASINPASVSTPVSYLQSPHSASPLSSASTPVSVQQSMYTAQASTSSLPPVLNMTIKTSPLQLSMGVDDDKRQTIGAGSSPSNHTVAYEPTKEPWLSPSTVAPSLNETPIADLYSTPSSSVPSFDAHENTQPLRLQLKPRPSYSSLASATTSFNHLSMALPDEEAVEHDWAQSVLAAADTDGSWSAKSVLKFFGGGS